MKATITIAMDNAAFEDSPNDELARILADLARHLKNGDSAPTVACLQGGTFRLRDFNGNTVGKFFVG